MVSHTADYALRAVLLLARAPQGSALRAYEIADATGAPRNYIAKVLSAIAKSGLVSSTRGPSGGFTLALPAADITLARIVDLFDNAPLNPRCMLGSQHCDPSHPCRAHSAWHAVTDARRLPLTSTSIADLLDGRVNLRHNVIAKESLNVA